MEARRIPPLKLALRHPCNSESTADGEVSRTTHLRHLILHTRASPELKDSGLKGRRVWLSVSRRHLDSTTNLGTATAPHLLRIQTPARGHADDHELSHSHFGNNFRSPSPPLAATFTLKSANLQDQSIHFKLHSRSCFAGRLPADQVRTVLPQDRLVERSGVSLASRYAQDHCCHHFHKVLLLETLRMRFVVCDFYGLLESA
ncbi:hypothetical protein KC325_g134 [Hortaea werneckii]|nr:hypothetical protein KC325_g134 [Hortaea werneckii]